MKGTTERGKKKKTSRAGLPFADGVRRRWGRATERLAGGSKAGAEESGERGQEGGGPGSDVLEVMDMQRSRSGCA